MPLFYHKYVNYVLAHSVNYVITLYRLAPPVASTLSISTTFAKEHLSLALLAPPVASNTSIPTTLPKPHRLTLSTTFLPPLLKVRCCRPKKFGRLPEGLLPIRTNHPKTSPSFKNRHHHCLLMNVPFVLHPHYPTPRTTTLASLVKGRWIDGKAQVLILLLSACDMSTIFML